MNKIKSQILKLKLAYGLWLMAYSLLIFILFVGCSKDSNPAGPGEGSPYAVHVVSSSIGCEGINQYTNPEEALGYPNYKAWYDPNDPFGVRYSGFVSLGPGGWITLKMGVDIVDGPGHDIAVYQAVSNEETAVYATENLSSPFILIGSQHCGYPCYFDLNGFVNPNSKFRYVMVQDASYPDCYETAGTDIDAVKALNYR